MDNQEAVLENLFKRTTHGIRFGLDRIKQAAEELGNPHHTFKSIHVAGTNGKGSVCAFLESILRLQGFTTGLFTSPHIVRFEERFIVNGACVRSEEWLGVYRDIESLVDQKKNWVLSKNRCRL
jgi:dihydrofolate synthase/folylpolyglutamate synthase